MPTQKLKVSRLYKDLNLDLSAPNPVTGDLPKLLDANAVKQAIKILIQTNFYERPFAPKKAGNIRGLLFEPMSLLIGNTIEQGIVNLLKSYEPRARIQQVQVVPDYENQTYSVTIRFYVVGINKPEILTANLQRIR